MSNRSKKIKKRTIPKIKKTPLAPFEKEMQKEGALEDDCEAYLMGEIRIMVGTVPNDGGIHLSISHPRRYPTWAEVRKARYEILPEELTFMMLLPPKDEYADVDLNCFHLHEHREPEKKIKTDDASQIAL